MELGREQPPYSTPTTAASAAKPPLASIPEVLNASESASTDAIKRLERGIERWVAIATIAGVVIAGLQFYFGIRVQSQTLAYNILNTRPWIKVDAEIGNDAKLKLTFKNEGKTPTFLSEVTYARFYAYPLTSTNYNTKLDFSDELSVTQPTGASLVRLSPVPETLPNSSQKELSFPVNLIQESPGVTPYKADDQIAAQLSNKTLYLWGAVLYEDGLKYQHETTFCFEHQPGDTRLMSCPFINALDREVEEGADCIKPKVDDRPSPHKRPCAQS